MKDFSTLGLHDRILKAVVAEGYTTPTPIQLEAIPHLLAGRDLLGVAQTGTGKTAAFSLPTLHKLLTAEKPKRPRSTRVLVLTPTRELAGQVAASFTTYSKFMTCRVQTVYGGVKIGGQIRALQQGTDVLVATPGRLLDLVSQRALSLAEVEVLVLDEADQMLDLGFIHDLKKIVAAVPRDRQTLLFSATMPKLISDLAQQFLKDPVRVSVTPQATTAERVEQGVIHVSNGEKLKLLAAVLETAEADRALIFTRTKHGADAVVRKLLAKGLDARAIHGNKSQPQRLKALEAFKDGTCPILVATDIAARGIDIDGVSHVINYEMPNVPEQYVHRIGRTARAGKAGLALSFVAEDELYFLREIEKTIRMDIEIVAPPKGCDADLLPVPDPDFRPRKPKGPARGSGGGSRPSGRSAPRSRPAHKPGGGGNGGKPKSSQGQRRGGSNRQRQSSRQGA